MMRPLLTVIFCIWCGLSEAASFKEEQLRYARVREAFKAREKTVRRYFEEKKLAYPPTEIFLRAFKREKELEVWARDPGQKRFTLVHTYPVCALSGALGPKVVEGDGQVPEGFYFLSGFNPTSSYHLSLRVNYPNPADLARTGKRRPGGDIFVHGDCVTIGCLPLTDPLIEEVYLLAVEAHSAQKARIPIHIFPGRLDSRSYARLLTEFKHRADLTEFWKELKVGFDSFEIKGAPPQVTVDAKGKYQFP